MRQVVVRQTISAGTAVGVATAAVLLPFGPAIVSLFTSDPAVHALAASAWPVVALSQPLSTLAFAYDGLLFGTNDFRFCALLMVSGRPSAHVLPDLRSRALGC